MSKSRPSKLDVLAFGAHPDDVELGCAGTLAKLTRLGYSIGIVDLTEGEMASRGTVPDRYKEAEEAARILSASVRLNLQIPDAAIENNSQNRMKILEVVRQYKPTVVFLPYPEDRHPDHIHASELIREGCFYAGLTKIESQFEAHRPNRLIFYPMTYEFTPSFVVDISDTFEVKLQALKCYRSQFYNPEWQGKPTFVSSQWFMEAVEFKARHYGWLAGVKYGEPFFVRELLAVEDVVSLFARSRM